MTAPDEHVPILVTGATGKQGGATARALLARGVPVRALVRHDATPAAQELQRLGVELFIGDLDDPTSLPAACSGVHGVFSIQNPDFADLEADTELVRGVNLIAAARQAGVVHFIQTTATGVGDYYRQSGWGERRRHNNSVVVKGALEDRVKEAGFAAWTILRPSFFMENLPYILRGDRLVSAYDPASPVPMVAVADIGGAAACAFLEPDRFSGLSVELAGEFLTMPAVAEILTKAWGRQITAPVLTPGEVLAEGFMLPMVEAQEWHNEVGLPARPQVAHALGLNTTSLETWAETHPELSSAGDPTNE